MNDPTEQLFRENLNGFEVTEDATNIQKMVKRWSEPKLRSGCFYRGKGEYTTVPIDRWKTYKISDDGLHLHLTFDFTFPNGNNYLDLEYKSLDELRDDLNNMIEWAGK